MFEIILGLIILAQLVIIAEPIGYGKAVTSSTEHPYVAYVDIIFTTINPKTKKSVKYSNACGGIIITPGTILTAAHCLTEGIEEPEVIIYAGVLKLAEFSKSGQIGKMKNYIIHPEYYPKKIADLAIIRLQKDLIIKPGNGVQIANLGHASGNHRHATVVGWGNNEDAEISDNLRKITMRIFHKSVCGPYYGKDDYIICAWADDKLSTPCVGDSGGPLILDGEIIGLVSKVLSMNTIASNANYIEYYFCAGDRPTIFVDLHKYHQWISNNKNF